MVGCGGGRHFACLLQYFTMDVGGEGGVRCIIHAYRVLKYGPGADAVRVGLTYEPGAVWKGCESLTCMECTPPTHLPLPSAPHPELKCGALGPVPPPPPLPLPRAAPRTSKLARSMDTSAPASRASRAICSASAGRYSV